MTKQSADPRSSNTPGDAHQQAFNVEFEGDLASAVSAPITEIAILHFDRQGPPQDYLTRFEEEALPIISENHARGFVGIAFGMTQGAISVGCYAEPIPTQLATQSHYSLDREGQGIVIVGGYQSIEAHEKLRADKDQFEKVAPLLVRNASSIDKCYVQFTSSLPPAQLF